MARPPKLLLLGLIWLGLLMAAPAALAATVNLRYWGGPVAHSMNVYLVRWGSDVRSTYTAPDTGDPAFLSYLASQSGTTGDIGGVLAQYMDTSGVNSQNKLGYGGMNAVTPPTSGGVSGCSLPGCVDDSVIQSQLQSDISANTLPAPAEDGLQTMYVVLFGPGTNVCMSGSCAWGTSSGFCAYHGSFELPGSTTQVLYAPIVDDGPGTPNATACGSSASDIANQTSVVSHEVAETINDPLVAESSRNGPPLGWYDSRNGEVADICAGSSEQALNGSWTVQKIWSNRNRACVASESAYSAPTASFVADRTAQTAQSVSFDGSASSDPAGNSASAIYSTNKYSIASGLASYRWDWGDGSTSAQSSSPIAAHAYASAGNYEVSLTVTDNLGFTSTVTQQIAVTESPEPPTVSTPPTPAPQPSTGNPTPPPSVATGAASAITSSGATVAGSVNPNGAATSYQVQFGPSTSYGFSSAMASAGAGTTSLPVRVSLSGLKPGTTYHYRLVASEAGATVVGADATFTTARALAAAPRFSFRVLGHPPLARALRAGLKVRFTCSRACLARFSVVELPRNGVLSVASFPLSVAAGTGRLRARGSGTAVLSFTRKARNRLRRVKTLRASISGVVSGTKTVTSSPVLRTTVLRRTA